MEYDPQETTYRNLLSVFWENHDSTVCHKRQYMSAVFYHDEEQKRDAELTREKHQEKMKVPVVTKIMPAQTFYDAENYHQKYLLQQQSSIFASLGLGNEELKNSYVAARLNGYLGGCSTLTNFDAEVKKLGLSEEQAEMTRRRIGSKSNSRF